MSQPLPIWPPVAGTYAMSLVRNGPLVAVRIWFGAAVIGGEEQDRSWDWRCEIDGKTDYPETISGTPEYRCHVALPISKAWPYCAKRPISEADYQYMKDHANWAIENKQKTPDAQPRKPIDRRGPSVF